MMTKSKVRSVRHVVMSAFINSMGQLFSSAFDWHADNISGDVSMPVIVAFGLCSCRHNDTPPVPMPTSRTLPWVIGANAASHTASDVGLYMPRCIFTRPPSRLKISCL